MTKFILACTLLISVLAFAEESAQQMPLPTQKIETDPRIKESYQIIDDIKALSPPDSFRVEYRQGLMQTLVNTPDSVDLNKLKSLPFLGLETVTRIYDDFQLELRGYYARNFLFERNSDSPNGDDAYEYTYDGGPRYRFVLDPTQTEDFVALKILYHYTRNNFRLSNPNLVYIKEYQGIIFGLERSIPVTPKIGLVASLDLTLIQSAVSDSEVQYEKNGIGFTMRGAAYYRVDWFGVPSKVGAAYWQGGAVNKFTETAQSDTSRVAHVQTFRAVSLSYTLNF